MPSMQLKDIRLTKLEFQINPDFNESAKEALDLGININNSFNQEKRIAVVDVLISIPSEAGDTKNPPFKIQIRYSGIFEFSDDFGAESVDNFQKINCPAIIFPYLREAVADVTRRAGFPPLHLPTINFIELNKNNQNKNNIPKGSKSKSIDEGKMRGKVKGGTKSYAKGASKKPKSPQPAAEPKK